MSIVNAVPIYGQFSDYIHRLSVMKSKLGKKKLNKMVSISLNMQKTM